MCFKGFSFDIKKCFCIIFSWAILRILWFLLPYFKTKGARKKNYILSGADTPAKGGGSTALSATLKIECKFFSRHKKKYSSTLLYPSNPFYCQSGGGGTLKKICSTRELKKHASRGCYEIHKLR